MHRQINVQRNRDIHTEIQLQKEGNTETEIHNLDKYRQTGRQRYRARSTEMGSIRSRNPGRLLALVFALWNLMGIVSVAVANPTVAVANSTGKRATPRNMAEIIVGRCEEYQRVVHPELFQQNE